LVEQDSNTFQSRITAELAEPGHFALTIRGVAVDFLFRRADGPGDLVVTMTGITFPGAGVWRAKKHCSHGRRQRREPHLATDTLAIRVAKFIRRTDGSSSV
jgi:hypothetical protein